jgi:hypothetical protein
MSINREKAIGYTFTPIEYTFTSEKCIIYALSVGFNADPLKTSDMKFTYERHPKFSIFPSMIGAYDVGRFRDVEKIPGIPLPHRSKLLHGESVTEIHKQIKVGDTFKSNMEVIDVIDK